MAAAKFFDGGFFSGGGGGGGGTDHAALTNLPIAVSGHTGPFGSVWTFNGAGASVAVVGSDGDTLVRVAGVWTTTPLPVAPRSGQAAVDFGTAGDLVTVAVTGQTWVTANSRVMLMIQPNTLDHDVEDVIIEQLVATVGDYVAGTGFTIYVHAPHGTWGRYNVNWLGVA